MKERAEARADWRTRAARYAAKLRQAELIHVVDDPKMANEVRAACSNRLRRLGVRRARPESVEPPAWITPAAPEPRRADKGNCSVAWMPEQIANIGLKAVENTLFGGAEAPSQIAPAVAEAETAPKPSEPWITPPPVFALGQVPGNTKPWYLPLPRYDSLYDLKRRLPPAPEPVAAPKPRIKLPPILGPTKEPSVRISLDLGKTWHIAPPGTVEILDDYRRAQTSPWFRPPE